MFSSARKLCNANRCYSLSDRLCLGLDQAVRALGNNPKITGTPYPAKGIEENQLSEAQRRHSASLMRINHAGEICAQALYHGQGIVSQTYDVQKRMHQASIEEGDHLTWCRQRLSELNSHTSYLNPLWYVGSFCIGMVAGIVGDSWSLGFIVETEQQVIQHLAGHLQLLPGQDRRSYKILQQMEIDEAKHRDEAIAAGARELPQIIKKCMRLTAKVMIKITYWV
jgi:ubiquinone biosynthesis monooxygenase Coq7